MTQDEIKQAADAAIAKEPGERVLSFMLDGTKYWIKRKLSNGRNSLVKYSVEKEFFYEIARMTIAAKNCPDQVPVILVLTPDYMVTSDGGTKVKNLLDSDMPLTDKEKLLEQVGKAMANFHNHDVVHGRPALRDITYKDGRLTFLDWENREYSTDPKERKAIDYLLLLQGIYRERYASEPAFIAAVEKGYHENGGTPNIEAAKMFLVKHSVIGALTRAVAPFHWKDVEPVRKLYEHLVWEKG